jgi:hypothetical protein
VVHAIRQYSLPLMLAVALHALAIAALYTGFSPKREISNVIKPQIVRSQLLVLEQKEKPAPAKPVREPAREPAKPVEQPAPAKPEPRVDSQVEARKAEDARKAEEARRTEEARRKAEADRQARLRELAETSFDDLLEEEAGDIAVGDAEAVALRSCAKTTFTFLCVYGFTVPINVYVILSPTANAVFDGNVHGVVVQAMMYTSASSNSEL